MGVMKGDIRSLDYGFFTKGGLPFTRSSSPLFAQAQFLALLPGADALAALPTPGA